MLKVERLCKDFGNVVAVKDLSFELLPGNVCGFVGPNGAGKTTAMRMIATLEEPTAGHVYVDGESIYTQPYHIRRKIGFMPDHYGAYPDLLVRDYLEFYARAYEIAPEIRDRRINEIMDFTGLDKIVGKKVETLSKGMRQRLNLGRALINDPGLLVLDEPAAGLDPRARVELRYLVRELAKMGKAVFISSHILSELSEICDHMLIIDHGKAVTFGNVDDIRKRLGATQEVEIRLLDKEQAPVLERFLLERPQVKAVHPGENGHLTFTLAGEPTELPDLLRDALNTGLAITEFRPRMLTMEEVFIQITQGEFD